LNLAEKNAHSKAISEIGSAINRRANARKGSCEAGVGGEYRALVKEFNSDVW